MWTIELALERDRAVYACVGCNGQLDEEIAWFEDEVRVSVRSSCDDVLISERSVLRHMINYPGSSSMEASRDVDGSYDETKDCFCRIAHLRSVGLLRQYASLFQTRHKVNG